MKKTVFFDLGNVLLLFDHQKMYQQIADFCRMDSDLILQSIQNHVDAYERGSIDSRTIHLKLCQLTGKHLEFTGLMTAMSDIFTLNEGMVSLVKELKSKQVALFILSNTYEAHFNFAYMHYPLLHLFNGYVLSYEVKARKPEKEIFNAALSIAKCSKEESFYTDDIPEYIEAARALNIDAELFINPTILTEQLTARGIL